MKKILITTAALLSFDTSAFSQELLREKEGAHTGEAWSVAISSDGNMLLTGGTDKRAYLWDVKTGEKSKILSHSEAVKFVTFNASGKLFASASADGKIIVFDAKEGKPKRIFKEHTAGVNAVAFSPINDYVASAAKDNLAKIWDDKSGIAIYTLKGHTKEVTSVLFTPDGRSLITASLDNTIRIWDPSTGQQKNLLDGGISRGITALAISSDGKYLASGGSNGTTILWDMATQTKITDLTDFRSQANALAFSPDVKFLAIGGSEKKILFWDVESKKVAKEFTAHNKDVTSIAFSDKGTLFTSVSMDGSLKFWDVTGLKIGPKKFAKDAGEPKLVCIGAVVKEDNNNGVIQPGENAGISFTLSNKGKGQAYNVVVQVALEPSINGLSFEKEMLIGNFDADKSQKIFIPFSVSSELETTAGSLTIRISEANGFNPEPVKLNVQTNGANAYSYIMVLQHSYTSATGKAEAGAPITLKLALKNSSQGAAKNIKVNYLFPDQVLGVNKTSEMIPSISSGETKEISVEFYATKEFKGKEIKIGLGIEGAYSNADNIVLHVKMNEPLPAYNIAIAQAEPPAMSETPGAGEAVPGSEQPLYRGGGDPLKGLNIAKAKEMVIGNYYALIIGVDKYKGHWTPLQNAVADAKAVEALMKSKYKFDYFRTLYNEQATRENIIKEMEWLVANAKPNDNVFIYYSGHGEFKQDLNKGFWVPVDAETPSTSKYISNSDIQTFLGGVKSKHTLLVADACFSGDIFRGNTISVPFEESEKYYKEVHGLPSRQALTSGGIEPVMDGGKEGHSVFAYYFLKTLKENPNKYLDAGQLYSKIKIPVINNSEQSPKFAPVKNTGDEGGQFIFIKKQ